MESITNYVIKDKHGHTIDQGSLSVVRTVNVAVDGDVGTPSADATYEDGILTITLHNVKGERGNGIVSVEQTIESQESSGVNVVTITDDVGHVTTVYIKNGAKGDKGYKGDQGDSVIVGEGDLPLTHVLGGDNTKAISQIGVTEELTINGDVIDLSNYTNVSCWINRSNVWAVPATSGNIKCVFVPVSPGDILRITASSTTETSYAFLTSNSHTTDETPDFASGVTMASWLPANNSRIITAPNDAAYLYVLTRLAGNDAYMPSELRILKKLKDCIYDIDNEISELSDEKYRISELYFQTNTGKAIRYADGVETTSQTFSSTDWVNVENLPYLIYQRLNMSSAYDFGMAFYSSKSSAGYISGQAFGSTASSGSYFVQTKIDVPANAKYARFTTYTGFWIKAPKEIIYPERTVRPRLEFGALSRATGDIFQNDYGRIVLRTSRFTKVNSEFIITSSMDVYVNVMSYDKSFHFLNDRSSYIFVEDGVPTKVPLSNDAEYVKLVIFNDDVRSVNYVEIPDIQITGNIPEKWDIFNSRPSDSGYIRIMARVRMTDPNACDDSTDSVQDDGSYGVDYGILAIPPNYDNLGKPTRLIIYCHGAAVNYSSSVVRFNSQDCDPNYWLAEGYAVMDIEGNPFDNTNEHICIPQAMDCYVAAYKWIVENYNICRDGVFVGGRSMGGYNTFNLIRRECPIPVIAACPNVPSGENFGYSDATRKAFCALHMGFIVPDGFTWSNGGLTSAEKQILLDNWDKYCKCVPYYNMVTDLPDKEILVNNQGGQGRIDVLSQLHAYAKCPVKLFGCYEDPSCPPNITSTLYYRMLMNSAQMAELRLFHSYATGIDKHHYELQDPALRTDITTRYGEELTGIPVVYIEMLKFWQRYEQEEL